MSPNYEDVTAVVQSIIGRRDPFNHHMQAVAQHVQAIATRMNLSSHEIEMMRHGAGLHDIGKILVDRDILNLNRPLSRTERAVMEIHPVEGMKILAPLGYDAIIVDMVLHHHELLDGSGYPDRLKGEQISIYARILSVADVYDALTNNRPYRPAKTHAEAMAILHAEAAKKKLDKAVIDVLEQTLLNEG